MAAPPTANKAFEAAVNANMSRLIALARSMLGAPMRDAKQAEDIVQDTLLKLFRHRDTYDWSNGGWSLMAKAVARSVISCRRRKVGASLEADPVLSDGLGAENDPAAVPITAETMQTVRRHIEALPPAWREALILREQQEMGYREIAEMLDVTESQVKTWLHRARVRLAGSLREHLRER
ncbi:MAG TPA: sigma-70 family RNA polymerase sigma factor [Phycisphaerae bacterium]|nr:sigma-70 family RNA polymerase sigma factor [Phycisphaerae bacterium]